ncbi:MAG: uncharacterized protein QOI91_1769 [Solirubrobacteraceae bacterium]|jgi:hypothetical protein|nr:uncharacterized protein [Solirubrobacteraceae bacterium]
MERVADELARSEAERACLDALRELAGGPDGPLERHSVRAYLLAVELAGAEDIDRELLLCAALLHDAGLYPGAETKAAYVTDGRVLAERVLAPFAWPAERLTRCGDAVERHHELRSQAARGAEVELLRRADRIEVSQGLIREGLDRAVIRDIRRRIPTKGFVPEILRLLGRAARRRPASLPRIFKPGP